MTDELVAWLRARVDEDEAIAFATINATDRAKPPRWVYTDDRSIRDTSRDAILRVKHTWNQEAAHITRHDPARVLRDIEAKRAILDGIVSPMDWTPQMQAVVRHLAAVYADKDGYREEWAPEPRLEWPLDD